MHHPVDLDSAQRRAVESTEGPLLVLAGAGSGKTRTLVRRIAWLLSARQIDPRRIVAITFTNRAALEMRERTTALVGDAARSIVLSTFHSLGARILREFGEAIGLPRAFAIYPASDQMGTVRQAMAELRSGNDRPDVRAVQVRISEWKNRMMSPAQAAAEVATIPERDRQRDEMIVLAADVYARYEDILRSSGACDFDDLLLLPVRLLKEDQKAREALWNRWHYFLVDEYQDTNAAQFEMARLLSGARRNLCVVGDDDQSIYAWRGADHRNILEFERHYPGATVVTLQHNYRTTGNILTAASALISHNTVRHPKSLTTPNPPGPLVRVRHLPDDIAEAEFVARDIARRHAEEGSDWSHFAILVRTNTQTRPFEEAMRSMRIPYRVIGGTSFFDRKEVADAAAYLRIAANVDDEIALRRVIAYPARGIGSRTVQMLTDSARAARQSPGAFVASLGHTNAGAVRALGLAAAPAAALQAFGSMLDRQRIALSAAEAALAPGTTLIGQWARAFIDETGLYGAIRDENPTPQIAESRASNLRTLTARIDDFETRWWQTQVPNESGEIERPTLATFLADLSLDDREQVDEDRNNAVSLMTLHAAKGLEFTTVYIPGMEEELLPHSRTVMADADAAVDGVGITTDPVAEERRLLYVGMTRARHRLTLLSCRNRRRGAGLTPREPSRFLAELPIEVLDVEGAEEGGDADAVRTSVMSKWRTLLADQPNNDASKGAVQSPLAKPATPISRIGE